MLTIPHQGLFLPNLQTQRHDALRGSFLFRCQYNSCVAFMSGLCLRLLRKEWFYRRGVDLDPSDVRPNHQSSSIIIQSLWSDQSTFILIISCVIEISLKLLGTHLIRTPPLEHRVTNIKNFLLPFKCRDLALFTFVPKAGPLNWLQSFWCLA